MNEASASIGSAGTILAFLRFFNSRMNAIGQQLTAMDNQLTGQIDPGR